MPHWLAIISSPVISHMQTGVFGLLLFSLCSILYFFAKGASKLGHVKLWDRLRWKLTVLGFSWKAAVLIFISTQNQIAQKWQWQKQFLAEKKIIVMLEREKHNKKSQLKMDKSKIWFDLVLSRWDSGMKLHCGLKLLHLMTDLLTCSHQMLL